MGVTVRSTARVVFRRTGRSEAAVPVVRRTEVSIELASLVGAVAAIVACIVAVQLDLRHVASIVLPSLSSKPDTDR